MHFFSDVVFSLDNQQTTNLNMANYLTKCHSSKVDKCGSSQVRKRLQENCFLIKRGQNVACKAGQIYFATTLHNVDVHTKNRKRKEKKEKRTQRYKEERNQCVEKKYL